MAEKNKQNQPAGDNGLSRRDFLKVAGAGLATLTVVPGSVLGQKVGKTAPSDKLNIAGIGVGGRGLGVLKGMESQNIVALCDVDWKYSKGAFARYPDAKKYWDYRKMFDEMSSSIDAVMVATADHTHALIASSAMALGKHVYCEKPLTHSVYESRLLTKMAEKQRVATQMGNQGSSGEGVRRICDLIWNGAIGEVTKVEAFTNRPIWPQGLMRPAEVEAVPDTLNWDLFIGPAPMRPYNSVYTPWNWRGWWDFGTGALGDMACHILHPVFKALKLGYPVTAEGSSTPLLTESAPNAQFVKFVFPKRDKFQKVDMPQVEVTWYDGGLMPPRPAGMPDGKDLDNKGGGVIFHGTKDTLICGCYGADPWLISGKEPKVPSMTRKVPDGHQMDFVRAAKENADTRIETASPFSEAGPFNEMVVMGVLAVRLQGLNKVLQWDGPNMQFTNIGPNEKLKIMVENGFSIKDGHPTFNKKYTQPFNAKQFADELIKHNYRDGWKLEDMPK